MSRHAFRISGLGRDTGPASSEQCARHGPQQGESIEFLRE
ncbi:hypothetical protein [Pseudomonas phage vB_Pae_BR213a]|nr:hypothetical protein [Pseudomonas phage vB_Pae_BR213a]